MSTIYVLGSGFSSAAGAPLSRQVLSRIFCQDNLTPQLTELQQWLSCHLFSRRPRWQEEVNIEEVLTRLDLYRHYQALNAEEIKDLNNREELLLTVFTQLLQPERVNLNPNLYRRFANGLKPGMTIITYNYDLLLEKSFTQLGIPYYYPQLGDPNDGIRLLKLHGSLNLYFCPKCGYVHYFGQEYTHRPKVLVQKEILLNCIKCSENGLEHLTIAPTLFKSYEIPTLRNWWFIALQALSGATEVFFIGYSVPRSDLLAAQLFDFAARLASKPPKVWLINGPRNDGDHHVQIFEDSKVVNTRLTFEQWMERKTDTSTIPR
ncbi:MAG: SIR2 family protein [Clostridia bacterium]|nr:SIR2 family protein [Clostridia bacterium]